ncbi:glycosyltransferase [Adlercreutzia shanghongiae]|uniref:Glycosyltransferase n=1 Tax=Adlercreutzia shanghongiae TaxID=3111773 RepID=A0ABU6J0S3_9ACTN|nr:glycosyltransferase [Adlercreutzia sp. R22]MEC4295531.1 glycosyltransferase [Adlercreutzia sp. R22]
MQKLNRQAEKPTVSIIMPVKNTAPYLDECLSSIENQTFANWELICIDDASTDSSGSMLDEFSKTDSRIKVVHQDCGDAGAARNLGLDLATGLYVIFLDSDDFFEPTMLEKALATARKHDTDITLFGGRRFDDRTKKLSSRFQFVNTKFTGSKCFNRNSLPHSLFQTTYPGPCGKLFRKQFLDLQQLRFQSLPNAEDLLFTLSAMASADKIIAFDGDFIRYRVNARASNEATKHLAPLCFLDALFSLKNYLEDQGLYSLLKDTFAEQVLSTARYNLDTVETDEAREAILEALQKEPFVSLGLLNRDKNEYPSTYAFHCARYLKSALTQQRTLEIEQQGFALDNSLECVVERRATASPVVSAIVPVYNTGHLVTETLDSICCQSLADIEIICIDDGSTDNSLSILTEYAQSDPRISVYHQRNRGLGATRNAGQLLSKGNYLSFVDSDDLLAENAYSLCVERAMQDDLDVVCYDAISFYESEQLENNYPTYHSFYQRDKAYSETCTGLELLCAMVEGGDYKPTAWLYLTKRSFLADDEIYTHPGIIHEDNSFTFSVLTRASKAAHIKMALYKRRVREGSIMTSPRSFSNAYGYYACSIDMMGGICGQLPLPRTYDTTASTLLLLLYRVQHNAREAFANLPEYEMGGLKGMPAASAQAMATAMEQAFISRKASEQLQNLARKASSAQKDVDRIQQSAPFKIARLITAPLRFARKLLTKQ